ncbi:MAG: hypothetical protein IJS50_06265 [Desulfovibrio sp.]|nr:hypothetical protein [Desulfovibrio sp.]
MDLESLLTGMINSRLTKKAYTAMQASEREDRGMPDSTRRAFLSRMKSDSAVARMASQNMEDAKAMVQVAQDDITAIKSQFQEIQKALIECRDTDGLTSEQVAGYNSIIANHQEEIKKLVAGSSFNGMSLMAENSSNDIVFKLQAGNSEREQKFVNLTNNSLATSDYIDSANNINVTNLNITLGSSYQAEANTALDDVNKCIDILTGLEGRYSGDIKSLDNLRLLFEDQADIFEDAAKRSSTESTPTSTILSELMSSGSSSILSGSA